MVKRRKALKTASPFACATIAFADAYLYCHGLFCYTLEDRLRILDLHNSGTEEVVIYMPELLRLSIPERQESQEVIFDILYASDGIVCCLFNLIASSWLIAFHVTSCRILVTAAVEPSPRTFVRHNQHLLYFGTNSGDVIDKYEEWVITCYDFAGSRWLDCPQHVPDIAGSEIGTTICFEIVDNVLIAVTNQVSVDADYVSFYSCFFFVPLGDRLKAESASEWRRNHVEGPIDDRWTSIQLEIDEREHCLKIVEGRQEWYEGSSKSGLRYYTTNLTIPTISPGDQPCRTFGSYPVYTEDSIPTPDPFLWYGSNLWAANSHLALPPLIRLLKGPHPGHFPPRLRAAENVHPISSGDSTPSHTCAKSKVRSYNPSASTALYLVDDPLPTDWQGRQRLRLRVGSRSPGPLLQDQRGHWQDRPHWDLSMALEKMYIAPPVTFWPGAQDPTLANESLDDIYRLMNPPAFLGNVQGTADERSLIYVTGNEEAPKAVIFINFDPAIRLAGLKKWKGTMRPGSAYVDVEEQGRTVVPDQTRSSVDTSRKGTNVATSSARLSVLNTSRESNGRPELRSVQLQTSSSWIWTERAMYQDIGLGYDFSL